MAAGNNKAREAPLLDWRSEFQDSALEALHRRTMLAQDAQQLCYALWAISGIFFAFTLADFALLGAGSEFLALLAIRTFVALCCMALALAVKLQPALAHRRMPVNLAYFVGITGLLFTIPLHPGTDGLHIATMVVATTTLYLLVPNRLHWILVWNAYLAIGFAVVLGFSSDLSPGMLASGLLLLGFANLLGWVTLTRLNRLQRRQFALLLEEQDNNRKLQSEIDERRLLEQQLRFLASTDHLTGIANRRHFFELAARELNRTKREDTPLAICMVDIDLFKELNDHHGHAVGDLVLATVATCCASVLRDTDIIGRYGGEEFIIALPGSDVATATVIAERLRAKVATLSLPMLGETPMLSVTVGVSLVAEEEMTLEPAMLRADEALYEGKAQGRNRVVVADAPSSHAAIEA
ncbi:GGDEF domain-containing protein [Halomonas sp. ANAO-440]|uniref:GGDEF domain-containing protein n=1 Tax=Halomonas sp. ANAO-440 TaxID=2861360 RepID=UPI001CAA7C49|nr:GGDEF domain-containing protein [Halomonas sp. ANAO-440]MBZ0331199.1 GGDEF domain-containing protein [Halomonas sp. ANAO-440]